MGYSICAQQELLRGYAAQHSLVLQQEFVDVETAKTAGRPGFNEMAAYLRSASGVSCAAGGEDRPPVPKFQGLRHDRRKIHFVKEGVVLSKEARSSDKFMNGIKVLMAKNYIDNLSEEVRKGLHTKAAQGLYPSCAPLGYMNVTSSGRQIIVPCLVFGPMVTKLYQ